MTDDIYMNRCLELAALGAGNVAPNPMVGALLVYDDRIIGEGYHEKYGKPHAEVNCINSVSEDDKGSIERSTLYVSLEPCSHYGKTPPCADLIIKSKIPKVLIGCKDSFTKVNGKGIEKLQEAGITIVQHVLEEKCIELNKRFFIYHKKCRPYIILKWAESADSKIASSGSRTFISNIEVNRLVHKWRSKEAAILIGTNTALSDDPSLTTRLWKGNNPIRIVLDMKLRLPDHLKIFNGETKTLIFNASLEEERENIHYIKIDENNIMEEIMQKSHAENIQSIIVEGGARLIQSFINNSLWDEARIIKNEKMILGEGLASPVLNKSILVGKEKISDNTVSFFSAKLNMTSAM